MSTPRNGIPGDIFRIIARLTVEKKRCAKIKCRGRCRHVIRSELSTLKSLRATCYTARAITVRDMLSLQYECRHLKFEPLVLGIRARAIRGITLRGRHISWIIRANSSFAAADLQALNARISWVGIVAEYGWRMDTTGWICDLLSQDFDPLHIYDPDFGPPRWRKSLEWAQASISSRWWTDYRPFRAGEVSTYSRIGYRVKYRANYSHAQTSFLLSAYYGIELNIVNTPTYITGINYDGDPTTLYAVRGEEPTGEGYFILSANGRYPGPQFTNGIVMGATTRAGFDTGGVNTVNAPFDPASGRLAPRASPPVSKSARKFAKPYKMKAPKMKWQNNKPAKHKQKHR